MKDDKKRILFLDKSEVFSGAEFCLNELALKLSQANYQVFILFNFPVSSQSNYNSEIPVHYRNSKRRFWMGSDFYKRPIRGTDFIKRLIFSIQLVFKVRRLKIDIVHINLLRNTDYFDILFSKIMGCVVIGHVRSLNSQYVLNRRILNLCDSIICTSNAVRAEVIEKSSLDDNIYRIYDPIELSNYSSDLNRALNEGAEVISSIGLLDPRKGHEIAIRAFSQISADFPKAELNIVGDINGLYKNEFERLSLIVNELGLKEKVKFTGFISEVVKIYRMSRVVLGLSVDGEAFGRVAIESGVSGSIFIGTDIGATIELVDHGVTGFLVKPYDVVGTSQVLREIFSGKYNLVQIRENALRKSAFFSSEVHTSEVMKIYNLS